MKAIAAEVEGGTDLTTKVRCLTAPACRPTASSLFRTRTPREHSNNGAYPH